MIYYYVSYLEEFDLVLVAESLDQPDVTRLGTVLCQ